MTRARRLAAGSRAALALRLLPLLPLLLAAGAPPNAGDPRRSGSQDMSPALQAMQRDDAANPAFLLLADGERRFTAECAACHSASSMAGVAARYPAWDETSQRPLTLAGRLAACRERHVKAKPWAAESEERLALELWVAKQSRGLPVSPPTDTRLQPVRERGQRLFNQRLGQLDLSCAHCHEQHAGQRLAGSVIPQGHPNGYPLYRIEWQAVGSLQRRLRACMTGVRAQAAAFDADELTALEAFLMQRAAAMPVEAPAVRP
jgi:L-cysteine S-thiosulfotransferase